MNDRTRIDTRLLLGGLLIAFGLLFLAQTTGLLTGASGQWFGAALLAVGGLAFLAFALPIERRWWAVIPGGTLLSLAITTAAAGYLPGDVTGAIFLFGLAGTFAAVAVLPAARPRTWALIPAAVLGFVAAVTLASTTAMGLVWPLALILAGLVLVAAWAVQRRHISG